MLLGCLVVDSYIGRFWEIRFVELQKLEYGEVTLLFSGGDLDMYTWTFNLYVWLRRDDFINRRYNIQRCMRSEAHADVEHFGFVLIVSVRIGIRLPLKEPGD